MWVREPMIELWQVALGLAIFSFSAWFQIERTFGSKARIMRKRLLEKTSAEIAKIYSRARQRHQNVSEESLKKIVALYEESEIPTRCLDSTLQLSLFSGISFLVVIALRLATEYLDKPELAQIEGFVFLVGFIMLLTMVYDLCGLRKLVSSEEDPPYIQVSAAAITGLVMGVTLYVIWLLWPIIASGRVTLDFIIFVGFLFLSIPGGIMLMWTYKTESRWRWAAYLLTVSPWLYLAIVSLMIRFA